MSIPSRIFLLILAFVLAWVVVDLGSSFTYGAESIERARGSVIFWLIFGVAFASPLWLPAIMPQRHGGISTTIRWLSAAALGVPLWFIGSVVVHQLSVYRSGSFSAPVFGFAALLAIGCLAAIIVLIRPRVRHSRR
ncbi:MAG TPA: hypothetical protein VMV45_02920 [Casimicrobiaceae bacterium]|nr:hypothetical protein [Casimicrobiaceae bacterium]